MRLLRLSCLVAWTSLWLAGLACFPGALLVRAEMPTRCVVCQNFINGQFYWYDCPGELTRRPVCDLCSRLESICDQCRLPLRNPTRRLDDGRWLCDRDAAVAVVDPREALRIYEEVWRALQSVLAGTGTLPRRNIKVSLVNLHELKKHHQSGLAEQEDSGVLGLTHTRIYAGRQFQHEIFLLSGLSRARLAAVAAHEYGHTWLHENVPEGRDLDHDTKEGFCELTAYKLMTLWREEAVKRIILTNAYTRGQVNALVQAEAEHQFHRVVTWVKTGKDELIASRNLAQALELQRSDEAAVAAWPPPAPVATPVPAVLLLRGISGTALRRFALINDCTFKPHESARVRVGPSSNVLVHCVEIRERSAVIRVEGSAVRQELFLGAR